ncbi:hypothetical protein [Bradyrhizobium sp. BR 1433]|uniref:hypothetical protein n=1 Tax=Bradyrhizobium sp. BR 1433 TaxID=3447967 RepID=UPI003EE56A30
MRRAKSAPARQRKSGSENSIILISDGGGVREAMPAFLYVYVQSADETYRRAIAAGAEAIETPADTPYGDRRAMVRDSLGKRLADRHIPRQLRQASFLPKRSVLLRALRTEVVPGHCRPRYVSRPLAG